MFKMNKNIYVKSKAIPLFMILVQGDHVGLNLRITKLKGDVYILKSRIINARSNFPRSA